MILTFSRHVRQNLRLHGLRLMSLSFAVVLVTGCAYQSNAELGSGTTIDNPVERKFTWFSYLDAADIRSSCATGGPDQYRLVYNGQYYDHLRTYEVTSRHLTARVRGASGDLMQMGFNSFEELLGPWQFRRSDSELSSLEWSNLQSFLHQSGFGSGTQAGLRLHSQDFYWLAAGCEGGKFFVNAWADKPRALPLTRITFLDFLLRHDQSGIAYLRPRAVTYMDKNDQGKGRNKDYSGDFAITLRADGIGRSGL